MAAESGGSVLGGLINISGPENLAHQGIMAAITGAGGQANTRENLIQLGGPLGVLTVAEQQASRLAGKAFQEWARENRRRAKRGLAEIPIPAQAQYAYGGQLSRAGQIYAAAPSQPATQTPQPSQGGFWQGFNLDRAIQTGLRVAEIVAYFREMFRRSGGGSDAPMGYVGIFPGERPAPSPFQTVLGGGSSMPYLLTPSPSSGDVGFLQGAGTLAQGIGSIIAAIRGGQSSSMPGGAMNLGNYGGVFPNAIGNRINDVLGTGAPSGCAVGGAVGVTNPNTGKMVWFRRAGVPVLWSGDLAACKRVRKAASHARRRVGGR